MEAILDQKGMTLIETIVALVLVLILVSAFAGAFVVGLQSEADVDMWLMAGDTAESIMEFLSEEDDITDHDDIDDYDDEINFKDFFEDEDFIEIEEVLGEDSDLQNFYDNFVIKDASYINFTTDGVPEGLVQVEIFVKGIDQDREWEVDLVSRLRK